MVEAIDSICKPFMGLTMCDLSSRLTLKVHTKPDFSTLSVQKMGYCAVYQWRHKYPLLMKCPKTFFKCMMQMEELLCASFYLLWFSPTYVPQRLTLKLQKIQDVWISPLSTNMACQYEEERHSLIMKCLKTILRYMRQMEGALDSICLSIIGPTEPFSTKVGSQIACKMPHFGYHLSTENILWDVELQVK